MLKAVRTMLIIILNIIFYGLVVFGGVQLSQAGYSFAYDTMGDTSAELPPGQDKAFTVTESQGEYAVAVNLEKQKLIKSRYSFYLRMKLQENKNTSLQPGSYTLNTSMTYGEILNIIQR